MAILNMKGKETGLKLGDNTPDRTIECPHCNSDFDFNSNNLEWDDDGKFEFCEVVCQADEICGKDFQICAVSTGYEYEFFTMEN